MRRLPWLLALCALCGLGAQPFQLPVEEIDLENGMRFLLLPRPGSGTVEAGWIARAGSVDDPENKAGLAHLLEHMLFKGTEVIGTRDYQAERPLLEREERLLAEHRQLLATARMDSGLSNRERKRLAKVEGDLRATADQLRALTRLGEYSFLYSQRGAVDLNANTGEDFSLYYVTLPNEQLELWFWLESDRLLNPVFRDFEREKAVVDEERRLRIDARPTGPIDQRQRARFWGQHPYARNPLGTAEELRTATRAEAAEFFARHYSASSLTAALVGDFDPAQARRWARHYFARLPASSADRPTSTPAVSTKDTLPPLRASCRCPAQLRWLYPAPAFDDPEVPVVQILSGLLNGRAGRLYQRLVVEEEVAFAAYAELQTLRHAGVLAITVELREESSVEEASAVLTQELRGLFEQPLPPTELERVRQRLAADGLRQLREPSALLRRLLVYDSLAHWTRLAERNQSLLDVTSDAVRSAAQKYLGAQPTLITVIDREGAT